MEKNQLIDFYPKKFFKRSVLSVRFLFFLPFVGILAYLILFPSEPEVYFWIAVTLWLISLIGYIGINAILETGIIATNWDDMDYTGFRKTNIPFEGIGGTPQAAYLYIPDGIDIENSKTPAVIGFHGWNSHHREMDRYCLPTAFSEKFLYFTMDARGQGNTPGNKNDFDQFDDAIKFIDMVASLPYVDNTRIAVVGMSMGAARTAYAAYEHPYVRSCVMLSGPYDLYYTRYHLLFIQKVLFTLSGCKFPKTDESLRKFSGINKFNPDGVKLAYSETKIPNEKRVFLAANKNDPVVTWKNTEMAIEKLKLPASNYRIFPKGNHCFDGNEYYISVDIYRFLKRSLFEPV